MFFGGKRQIVRSSTLLIPIIKLDGSISLDLCLGWRLCADCKFTIIKCLEDIIYALPRVEEVFVAKRRRYIVFEVRFVKFS